MADESSRSSSHLFTVRVWCEELGAGRLEWRGKVQHITTGETRYFREWADLPIFMRQQVGDTNQADVQNGSKADSPISTTN